MYKCVNSNYKTHVFLYFRPHKCDQCEKSFHKLSDLNKHKSVHDGKTLFQYYKLDSNHYFMAT